MRVWVFGRAIPTKENNLMGSFELEQAQMLARHGCEVYYPVIDVRPIRCKRKFGFVKTDLGGVTGISFNIPIERLLPSKVRKLLILIMRLLQFGFIAIKYGMPDVIHVHYPSLYSYRYFCWMKKHGVKIICTEHWSKVQNKTINKKSIKNLTKYAKNCDAVICVGELLAKSFGKLTHSEREILVIPNIVSDDFAFRNVTGTDDVFRFVGVGRLVACKRFDLLIRAFIDEFGGDPHFRLDIIGGGEEYDSLKQLIHKHGSDDQITLLGTMARKDVAEYYHKCHALVMASNLETFGVPIIEAMASGLPVITTDAMGFPNLFHDEHGYLIPQEDEKSMAKAMRRMYENYGEFDREKISEYAKKTFGETRIANQLLSIYKGCVSL